VLWQGGASRETPCKGYKKEVKGKNRKGGTTEREKD
jgi:hypothetical protein